MLFLLCGVAVVTLLLTAFGPTSSASRLERSATLAPPVPAGPPETQIVALHGRVRLQLPIVHERVTAIGYHAAGSEALPLEPVGRRGNRGLVRRLLDRVFGTESGGLVWYQLRGGSGSPTSALDVGAAPDTDVFAPVDGVVVAITDYVLNGRVYGARIDLQPTSAPSLVVSVTRLAPDPALTVGSAVVAGASPLGRVLDLAAVEEQALARYTQDDGNHVTLEVRPATSLALP